MAGGSGGDPVIFDVQPRGGCILLDCSQPAEGARGLSPEMGAGRVSGGRIRSF